jgi:hypothetical protein
MQSGAAFNGARQPIVIAIHLAGDLFWREGTGIAMTSVSAITAAIGARA